MELYFLRHGKSVPRSEWEGDDESRPLTEAGVSALAHASWTLARLGVAPDVLITSPMERAQRTAEIVAPAHRPRRPAQHGAVLSAGASA